MAMKNCEEWQQIACSALHDAECIFCTSYIGDGKSNGLVGKIELVVSRMESINKAGLSLGFDFAEIPKLQNACLMLLWGSRVLSFCSHAPSVEVRDFIFAIISTPSSFFEVLIFDMQTILFKTRL